MKDMNSEETPVGSPETSSSRKLARRNAKYRNDPEFRERMKARSREYRAKYYEIVFAKERVRLKALREKMKAARVAEYKAYQESPSFRLCFVAVLLNHLYEHRRKNNELCRRYLERNPTKKKVICQRYYQNKKEEITARNMKWRLANPEKVSRR